MNIFRVMLVSLFAVSSLSYGAASSTLATSIASPVVPSTITGVDQFAAAAKLIGAGLVAGGATIGIDKLSPELSKGAILATLGVSTLAAARIICRADINTTKKSISLPWAGQYVPELNWFNAIAFGFSLASYGLYKNSDTLARVLKNLTTAVVTTTANV